MVEPVLVLVIVKAPLRELALPVDRYRINIVMRVDDIAAVVPRQSAEIASVTGNCPGAVAVADAARVTADQPADVVAAGRRSACVTADDGAAVVADQPADIGNAPRRRSRGVAVRYAAGVIAGQPADIAGAYGPPRRETQLDAAGVIPGKSADIIAPGGHLTGCVTVFDAGVVFSHQSAD